MEYLKVSVHIAKTLIGASFFFKKVNIYCPSNLMYVLEICENDGRLLSWQTHIVIHSKLRPETATPKGAITEIQTCVSNTPMAASSPNSTCPSI